MKGRILQAVPALYEDGKAITSVKVQIQVHVFFEHTRQ